MNDNLIEFINFLKGKHGISLAVQGEEIKLILKEGQQLDNSIINLIKDRKQEIVNFYRINSPSPQSIIPKADQKSLYQLSNAQKGLYFLHELNKDSTAFNMPKYFYCSGKIDKNRLKDSFKELVENHEILRTSFEEIDGEAFQKIWAEVPFELEEYQGNNETLPTIRNSFVRRFALNKAPLMRVGIVQLTDDEFYLMMDTHHIISDGTSEKFMIDSVLASYTGRQVQKPDYQFKDYSEWENSPTIQQSIRANESFWIRLFEDKPTHLDLPYDLRPNASHGRGSAHVHRVKEQQVAAITAFCKKQKISKFVYFLTIFNIFLKKISGDKDIVVGITSSGRTQPEWEKVIGMFVKTFPVLCSFEGTEHQSFAELMQKVQKNFHECLEHQFANFEELAYKLGLQRHEDKNAWFNVMLNYQNYPHADVHFPNLRLQSDTQYYIDTKFDISLHVLDYDDKIELQLEYNKGLFKEETIAKFSNYFMHIVDQVAENVLISDIELLTANDKRLLLNNNPPLVELPDTNVVALFEEQVLVNGQRTAITCGEEALTYQALNQQANKLANYLIRQYDLKKEDKVAIILERDVHMVAVLLAVLKAGGAYVPIDPELNQGRINAIIADSDAKIILTNKQVELYQETNSGVWLDLKAAATSIDIESDENPGLDIKGNDLAYCIYTSGSTGDPKGILIEHDSLLDFSLSTKTSFAISESDRAIQQASLAFDTSVEEIFPILISGASLVILPDKGRDIFAILDAVNNKGANILSTSPLILNELNAYAKELERLRLIIVGGDTLLASHIDKLILYCEIYQTYGPSEATVGITCGKQEKNLDVSNIGKPITNRKVYIFDSDMNLCPEMVSGELCVSGVGLAREYLNDPVQTKLKFIENPAVPGERIYRTGDMAKWLPNGEIRFLGRRDNQIKIRGMRVELGEIETHLLRHSKITDALVVLYQKEEQKVLVAYYVASEELLESAIKEHLSLTLPDYMIPACFTHVVAFPLNTSGKINKKKLPVPILLTSKVYEPPVGRKEQVLSHVWSRVLDIEKVGVTDNFFSLGGDSIKSMRIVSYLRMEGYTISVKDIFKHQRIRELARCLVDEGKASDWQDSTGRFSQSVTSDKMTLDRFAELNYLKALPTSGQEKLASLDAQYTIEDIYPLAPTQEGMLFHALLNRDSSDYFWQETFRLEGTLIVEEVERAFAHVVQRHTALRTVFVQEGFIRPLQIVLKKKKADFTFLDWRKKLHHQATETAIQEFLASDEKRGFNLGTDCLIRLTLLQLSDTTYQMVLSCHHIVVDGWSLPTIAKEFQLLYQGGVNKQPVNLAPATSYSAFINWLETFNKAAAGTYWENYLQGYDLLVGVPQAGVAGDKLPDYQVKHVTLDLSELEKLKVLSATSGVSLNTILQTAWGILIASYSDTRDAVFGSVVAGRPAEVEDVENIVGIFVNTIPVRVRYSPEESVLQLLKRMQQEAMDSLDFVHYSLPDVQKLAGQSGELFNHVLTFHNMTFEREDSFEELDYKTSQVESVGRTSFDLWVIIAFNTGLDIAVHYNAKVYAPHVIERAGRHLTNIIKSFLSDATSPVAAIDILTSQERHQILYEFNNTAKPYQRDKLIHELFEEQVAQDPDHIAVRVNGEDYSYKWLNERANQLASYLKESGLRREDAVTVVMKRNIELVIALLGILKAGGKYVPIEPYIPQKRKEQIIHTVEARFIVTDQDSFGSASFIEEELACLEKIITKMEIGGRFQCEEVTASSLKKIDLARLPSENLKGMTTSDHLAYVIFTSGSTGNPKGVAVQHRPVINLIEWVNDTYSVNNADVILMVSSVSFDLSVYDLFGGFACGATVRVANDLELASPQMLTDILAAENITFWDSAPAMLQQLIPLLESRTAELNYKIGLRLTFTSGDWIPLSMPGKIKSIFPNNRFIGLGGATEATIWSNFFEVDSIKPEWSSIPYGKPIQNAKYLVLDEHRRLCPVGIKGNLYIGGECLATSYFNEPQLSAVKFIDNPFSKGEKLYYTGDMARWFPDGNIEFLGRQDSQVKIRGYRIELGEIERRLLSHQDIQQVIVNASERSKYDKYICAYYVAEKELSQADLNAYLLEELPAYMLPSFYFKIDAIPITHNGKVDRKRLPVADDLLVSGRQAVSAQTSSERKLLRIFSKLLSYDEEKLSVQDDFFTLGGHSILAVYLMGEIEYAFGVAISLREIFESRELQKLALLIDSRKEKNENRIPKTSEREYYPLSSAQERLFAYFLYNRNSIVYNIPLAYQLIGDVEEARIKSSIATLATIHEGLRTRFEWSGNEVVQKIEGIENTFLTVIHALNVFEPEKAFKDFVRPFNLESDPLIRFQLTYSTAGTFLFVDTHHIICDGISLNNLMNDFRLAYDGVAVQPAKLRYVDYACWQLDNKDGLDTQKQYWLDKLSGNIPALELPVTATGSILNENGNALLSAMTIESDIYEHIQQFCDRQQVSEYMYLLSILYLLLYKVSGEQYLIIETDAAGKTRSELKDVIGTFVNILPLSVEIDPAYTYTEFLRAVRETVLAGFENQDFQYNDLVESLSKAGYLQDKKLSKVHFAYINYYSRRTDVESLRFEPLRLKDTTISSDYELKLEAQADEVGLHLSFISDAQLFEQETIQLMMDYYRAIINATLQGDGNTLGEIIM